MYEYIKGKLTHISPEYFVVEGGAIGYKIFVPINLYTNALKLGSDICLYTSFVVREDSQKLFGFLSKESRNFFEKLCSISGIGARTALSLIGHMDNVQLQLAIQTGNSALLSRVPGIGKKTAERIIVELGDTIQKWKIEQVGTIEGPPDLISDALAALINLGYNQPQATRALQKAIPKEGEPTLKLAALITKALQHV